MSHANFPFMKAKLLAPIAVVAALGFGTLVPHAQTAPQKVGFVDVQKVLQAHPKNASVKAIQDKASAELNGLDKQIKAIQAKGTAATAAEKDQLTQLTTTIQAKAKDYDAQLSKAVAPIETAVDAAVASTAKAQGFSIVMDRAQAATNGLVVYADQSTDITDAVVKNLKP
ncbi:OmpH family outer membrane protein [Deinococcus sonorensis]|uniref:OmpH family outer membrane protein n=2 Tax=Deinococcus sonorensis TaxID=309891 RepID=A0AAU7U9Z5_9DEIO